MAIARRLGMKLYDWQQNVLADCMPKFAQVALRAANESGKTSHICVPLVLWHLMIFAAGTVVITSGSWRQVKQQVFESLKHRADAFPGFVFNETEILGPDKSRAVGFSTDDPGLFEGWHALDHDESPLLIIVDEAKSVDDKIYEAISRCRPTRLLEMSSPGPAVGAFYRVHTSERQGWKHHKITAYQCPHIPLHTIEQAIGKYGIDNPLVRSMIFAEWMMNGESEKFVLPWAKLEGCLHQPPTHQNPEDKEAFCDFAVSPKGDECVLALRTGNKVEIVDAWKGSGDTIREAHRFVTLFQKHKLEAHQISGDSSGLGQGFCDVLATMGWHIHRVNNQTESTQPKRYANLGTEMWFEAAAHIQSGSVILPSNDERMQTQLTSRQYLVTLKGQLILMSKKDQPGPSPDRADAVVGCLRRYNRALEVADMFKADPNLPVAEMRDGVGEDTGMGNSWMSSTV